MWPSFGSFTYKLERNDINQVSQSNVHKVH